MFRTVPLSIIRSPVLYIAIGICHRGYAHSLLASSQHNPYGIYILLCVQYWTPDDGQRNCPKHAEFFISVINQVDAQNFCFTISLFHASTCFFHMCSKHVEAWNKLIVKQNFCASTWLITETNTPRCTVKKTLKNVEFYSQNNFQKLVHLVGFNVRMYHDAVSSEFQIGHNDIRYNSYYSYKKANTCTNVITFLTKHIRTPTRFDPSWSS